MRTGKTSAGLTRLADLIVMDAKDGSLGQGPSLHRGAFECGKGIQDMTKVRTRRLLACALTTGAAGGMLGLLGTPQAVAAEASADLSITKVGPTRTPDGRFAYQITVTNNGPDASSGWTVGDLMAGPMVFWAPNDIRSSDPRCAVVVVGYHGNVAQNSLWSCPGLTDTDGLVSYAAV